MDTPRPPHPLGEVIRRQRELNELSMRQFARLAGISNPYLSQIERGLRQPSQRVVDSIARTLDTSTETLYSLAGIDLHEVHDGRARAAIEADDRLTARQRRAILEVYDSFLALNEMR